MCFKVLLVALIFIMHVPIKVTSPTAHDCKRFLIEWNKSLKKRNKYIHCIYHKRLFYSKHKLRYKGLSDIHHKVSPMGRCVSLIWLTRIVGACDAYIFFCLPVVYSKSYKHFSLVCNIVGLLRESLFKVKHKRLRLISHQYDE